MLAMRAIFLAIALSAAPWSMGQAAAEDPAHGRDLVLRHCARCHVVADHNPYGGIGNAPSFHRLVTWGNGIWRVSTFFERPPHPVFTRVEGVPRRSSAPATAATFRLTRQDLQDIVAFAKKLRRERESRE